MKSLLSFVLEKSPVGVLVYDRPSHVTYQNRRATQFLEHNALPTEVPAIVRKMFGAIAGGALEETIPGRVCFTRETGEPPRRCTFSFVFREEPSPLVSVFLLEETASSTLDTDAVRQRYRLTRRETDLLRLVVDGTKNLEISRNLGITEQTVKDHLSNLYRKVGVRNRFALARHLSSSCHQKP